MYILTSLVERTHTQQIHGGITRSIPAHIDFIHHAIQITDWPLQLTRYTPTESNCFENGYGRFEAQ